MPVAIITVGKSRDALLNDAIQNYRKRLQGVFRDDWLFVPHAKSEGLVALQEEAKQILPKIRSDDFVVLLDERGKQLASPELSQLIEKEVTLGKRIVFIIGGAYGVAEEVKRRADFVWSLSPLVFPHRLVRLILSEQLYRAQTIASNQPYHHE